MADTDQTHSPECWRWHPECLAYRRGREDEVLAQLRRLGNGELDYWYNRAVTAETELQNLRESRHLELEQAQNRAEIAEIALEDTRVERDYAKGGE